jgi:Ca-activated chloride channel family protein
VGQSRQQRFTANKAMWWLAAACLIAAGLWLYRLKTDSDDPASPATRVSLRLNAVLAAGGKPLEKDVRFDVYEAATDAEGKRKFVIWDMGGQVRFPLPAGRYHVTAKYGSAFTDSEVEIEAGDQAIERTLNLQAGIVRLSGVLADAGKPLERDVRFDVYENAADADGKRKSVTWEMGGHARLPLSAGRYHVTAKYGSATTALDVEVTAGDEAIRRTLNLKAGILRLSAVLAAGGKPLERDVRFDVYENAADADGKRKSVTWEMGGDVRFPLSAGRYHVTARYGSATTAMDIEVAAGDEAIRRTLNLQAGILRLSAVLAAGGKPLEKDVRFDVYEAAAGPDGKRNAITWEMGGQVRFRLSAGRYYVTAGSDRGTANAEVTISAGQERPYELRLGPAKPPSQPSTAAR